MTCFRPNESARTEQYGVIRKAKRAVQDVMMDLSCEVKGRFDSEVSMETSVADMTPVSSTLRGQ